MRRALVEPVCIHHHKGHQKALLLERTMVAFSTSQLERVIRWAFVLDVLRLCMVAENFQIVIASFGSDFCPDGNHRNAFFDGFLLFRSIRISSDLVTEVFPHLFLLLQDAETVGGLCGWERGEPSVVFQERRIHNSIPNFI